MLGRLAQAHNKMASRTLLRTPHANRPKFSSFHQSKHPSVDSSGGLEEESRDARRSCDACMQQQKAQARPSTLAIYDADSLIMSSHDRCGGRCTRRVRAPSEGLPEVCTSGLCGERTPSAELEPPERAGIPERARSAMVPPLPGCSPASAPQWQVRRGCKPATCILKHNAKSPERRSQDAAFTERPPRNAMLC